MKRWQRGDAGAVMLVMMALMALGFLWYDGMHRDGAHGGARRGDAARPAPMKTALDLLDEAYARGEITREEYLQRRADLLRR